MQVIAELSSALSAIVEAIEPSVVRVEARRHIPSSGIVWAPDGLIVTAAHTIETEEEIRVGVAGDRTVAASLVGRDATTDVAVLRADADGLQAPEWGHAEAARVGQLALSLGRPGRTIRAALGMLSAVADEWQAPSGARIERYMQVDAGLPSGFSGGPLADGSGRVLGMNTSHLLRRTALAVPAVTLQRIVEALVTHGRIRRGYLGIGAHPVRLPAGSRAQIGQETGLLVITVEPGSPAEQAGLFLGDVLVGVDGSPVHHLRDLIGVLGGNRIGATMSARVLRAGALRDVPIVIGERR